MKKKYIISKEFSNTIVLVGDIGGTNARLRLSQLKNEKKDILHNAVYKVRDYDSIIDVIKPFLKEYKDYPIKSICLAIAGPIINNTVKVTNSNWNIDARKLKEALKIDNIQLINDFAAIGYGIESISNDKLYPLQKVSNGIIKKDGLKAFIGAGTGLGVGFASLDKLQYVVHPTEGGHASFAPADDTQISILIYLRKKYSKDISAENLLSGSGIRDIYQYFREVNPSHYSENQELKMILADKTKDAAKEITTFALKHPNDLMSVKTVETFVKIYGSKSADIIFSLLPSGGLYIVGNIAENILGEKSYRDIFMKAFANKDKISYILNEFPVWLVKDTKIGLEGAENCAFKLALS